MNNDSRMESESPTQTDEEEADNDDFPHELIKTWDSARRYFDLSRNNGEDVTFIDQNASEDINRATNNGRNSDSNSRSDDTSSDNNSHHSRSSTVGDATDPDGANSPVTSRPPSVILNNQIGGVPMSPGGGSHVSTTANTLMSIDAPTYLSTDDKVIERSDSNISCSNSSNSSKDGEDDINHSSNSTSPTNEVSSNTSELNISTLPGLDLPGL